MKKAIFVLSLIILISCGKSPEEKYQQALENFKASKTDAVPVIEASVMRHGGFIVDDDEIRSGSFSLYSVEGSKVLLYGSGGVEKYIVPEGAPFFGAVVSHGICYIAAGKNLLIYNDSSTYDRVVTFPGKAEVSALVSWKEGILILAGRKLYILRSPLSKPEPVIEKAFASPDKKTFRGFLTRSGNLVAVVLGYAGRYHIALVDAARQKIVANKISATGGSCYIDGRRVYYVSGGAGAWKVTRFDGKTKVKKTVGSFKSIINVSLFKSGFALETPKGVELFDYKGAPVLFPATGQLKGRTGDNLVVTIDKEKTISVPFGVFRKDLVLFQREIVRASSGR